MISREELEHRMRGIAAQARALLVAQGAAAKAFLDAWPMEPKARPVNAHALAALAWLDGVERFAAPETMALARDIVALAASLDWRQTYGAEDFGARFLERYGWSEFFGQRGLFVSDVIACGVLLLGPELEYPLHSHVAEEIYIPLAGASQWKMGATSWNVRAPGACIHHASGVPHAMRTDAQPLLALYFWCGGDLQQKSRIEPA
jgi:hypothetical protein